jgi:hypothetical protein
MAKPSSKDLALLQMLDEQTLLAILQQEMTSGGSFVDKERIKLNAKYMNNPDVKQVLDIVYAAIDGGEDAETVVNELTQRLQDPNDTSIPKLNDINQVTDIVAGVLSSNDAKTKAAASGSTGLEVLAKLGVPEFAPLLTKIGTSKKFAIPDSPYAGTSATQAKYLADADLLSGRTAGLKAETTRGPKTDWATARMRDTSRITDYASQEELDAFRENYGGDMPNLVQSPLDKAIGGKDLPVGKALDIGSKAARFLWASKLGMDPFSGAIALGKVNKTGTGWENKAGSKTESPEEVKKRQALALIAFKKNQQDIADAQQAAADEQARQSRLNEMYNAGTMLSDTPRSGNIFDKAAFAQGVYNQQKTTKTNNALGPSGYDLTRYLLAKGMRG